MTVKFTSITGDLLARKGEAAPSPLASAAREPVKLRVREGGRGNGKKGAAPSGERFVFTGKRTDKGKRAKSGPQKPQKPRRIVLNLTAHEYETLGLVAVKKDSTRQKLAQEAMMAYFEWLVAEYGEACTCIVGGALCRCEGN